MKYIARITLIGFVILSSAASFADNVTSVDTKTTVTTSPSGDANSNTNATTKTSNTVTSTSVKDNDADIVTAIYAKYAKDSALIATNLSVSCLNGIVSIYGKVTAQAQADEAVIVAKSIKGVKDARSYIEVSTNPANTKAAPTPNY